MGRSACLAAAGGEDAIDVNLRDSHDAGQGACPPLAAPCAVVQFANGLVSLTASHGGACRKVNGFPLESCSQAGNDFRGELAGDIAIHTGALQFIGGERVHIFHGFIHGGHHPGWLLAKSG